jgi:CRP-like cAMP-binding protein
VSLEDDIRRLSRISILGAMETDALRLIAFGAETKILRAGDVLFRRGDKSDAGFIVLRGSIALQASDDGSAAAQIIEPESLIGEIALLVDTERPATAIARGPSTVLKISRTLFHRVLGEYPQSAVRLRAAMADKLKAFLHDLEGSSAGGAE